MGKSQTMVDNLDGRLSNRYIKCKNLTSLNVEAVGSSAVVQIVHQTGHDKHKALQFSEER